MSQDSSQIEATDGELGKSPDTRKRQKLLEQLAKSFDEPEAAGIDWDLLRDGKLRAWRHSQPSTN